MQYAKPSTPPRQGTAELFFDINNYGYPTVYYPDGTTQPLVADITVDGETLVIGTRINEVYTNYCEDTKQGNGFYQIGGMVFNWSNGILILSSDNAWYYNGCKYTLTSAITIQTSSASIGLNYIYFVGDVLTITNNPSSVDGVLVCTVYKISSHLYICGDERHNTFFDPTKVLNSTASFKEFNNAKILNGLELTIPTNVVSSDTTISNGSFSCDDMVLTLPNHNTIFMPFAQEYSSSSQMYINQYDSLGTKAVKYDSNNKVQYFLANNGSGSWTTLTDNYYTSYIIFLTNHKIGSSPDNDFILFSYNEGIETANFTDFDNINIHIPLDCIRYMTPLYRLIVDKNGNVIRTEDLRGMDISSYSRESYHSTCTSKVFCDYTRTDSNARYDIINYMGATGDFTTTVSITADGSAATGLYVSGEVDALLPMASITNDGAGTSLEVSNTDGGLAFKADGRTALGIETISAGATIVPVGNKPIIKVTSDSSSQDNLITMPTGVSGQILTIINLDEDPITSGGSVYVPSGEAQQYIYVDSTVGWMPLGYGQVVTTVVQS